MTLMSDQENPSNCPEQAKKTASDTNATPADDESTSPGEQATGSSSSSRPEYPLLANNARCCRICLDDDPHGLYSPCRCRGSIKFVHSHCLTRW
ncbi:hypothetical protein BCR41DRAFT_197248 [Lobosporangium transversale]|uniref:RING-CH-type domain-containing protein n=1 Tax=Lobosporangium transversale TaxID=64571 RepID=A0A1Y2G8Q9_9FUNG|nr:hypothetical protein BCR41DRAFT_197248 [Lobosporangium transversale]ORZ04404.1 hypothetical protein BCR41DRAFT_197248 [Lobosporangium transversale]|eukprot:XP_021876512.1 hypothetical protein BCR41DRAFT_197248 [Lobosporangium transversale]